MRATIGGLVLLPGRWAVVSAHGAGRTAGEVGPEAALIDTVVALRDELAGLRSASQFRAVIEQAKGVLVERHHISLDEAFDKLRAMSQEHNVRLVEVAATVVGVTLAEDVMAAPEISEQALRDRLPLSPAASPTWRALIQQPDVRAGVLAALVDSLAVAASKGDEAAQLLADLLAEQEVRAVTLYRSAADGALRLVGQSGVPGDLVSSWSSIPPSQDIPYVRSLTSDQPFFWADRAERTKEFPAVASTVSGFEATATIPVHDAGSVAGVVGLMWATRQTFDRDRREAIAATVQRVAHLSLRNASEVDPQLEWLSSVLRLHLDPWLLLGTVPGVDAMIQDFVIEDASAQVGLAHALIGRRLLEVWPSVARGGVVQELSALARSGGSWTMTVAAAEGGPWGTPGSRVRAVRLNRRVVLVWRPGPA